MCSGVDSTVRKAHCQPSDRLNSCNRSGVKCDAAWTTWHAHGLSGNARCPMAMRIAIGIMESWDDSIASGRACVAVGIGQFFLPLSVRESVPVVTVLVLRVPCVADSVTGSLTRYTSVILLLCICILQVVVHIVVVACWTTLVQLICTLQL